MSLINNLIVPFSPSRALKREVAAKKYKMVASQTGLDSRQETKWRGASRVIRSMKAWFSVLGGPRSDLPEAERKTLISRSRDAYRNHLVARAAVTRGRTRIVGTGLRPHASVDYKSLGLDEGQAKELNEAINREFRLWAINPYECDAEGTQSFYQLQGLVLISSMLSGDVFSLTPFEKRPGGIYGLKTQVIEADRVSNPNSKPNSATLCDGIKLSDLGLPEFVWTSRTHPGEQLPGSNIGWDPHRVWGLRTGRRRVMHIWNEKERPGQIRGAPFLAAILEPLLTLEKYTRAELTAAVVSGMFTVFIEKDPELAPDETDTELKAWEDGTEDTSGNTATKDNELSLDNGAVLDLDYGEKATAANPTRPNANYGPFLEDVIKQIGASLEIPYEELMLHYSASYSAARAAMLQAWHWYVMRRDWLVTQFCSPMRDLLLDEAVARGRLNLPGYGDPAMRAAYARCKWIGPARGAVDELKEVKAMKERTELGVTTIQSEAAALGNDSEEIHEQRVRERAARVEGGLEPVSLEGATVEIAPPDEDEDGEGKKKPGEDE